MHTCILLSMYSYERRFSRFFLLHRLHLSIPLSVASLLRFSLPLCVSMISPEVVRRQQLQRVGRPRKIVPHQPHNRHGSTLLLSRGRGLTVGVRVRRASSRGGERGSRSRGGERGGRSRGDWGTCGLRLKRSKRGRQRLRLKRSKRDRCLLRRSLLRSVGWQSADW